ncbi:alpha/beta fold hydrolase [Planococcus sp. APC 4015]|nr:alpha/beta fold hydrolase [Planococcus sp. APC 4015]
MYAARRRPRRVRAFLAIVITLAVGVVPLTMTDAAHAGPRHPSAVDEDEFESAPCAVDVPARYEDRVRCGHLTVPERRDAGADPERTLRLPFAVIAAGSEAPAADPLVVPTIGDTGAGTLHALPALLAAEWMYADRDVILVEQRGGVLAEPSLDCPELSTGAFIDDGTLVTGDAADARRLTLMQQCRDRLVADGIDLSAYTSAASAADLADLRAALGYDAWNLYGAEYGSRLALTVLRDQPAGIRSVVLDGVQPPNVNRYEVLPAGFEGALTAVIAACAADAHCAEAYPDLADTLEQVFARAQSDPLSVTASFDGSPVRVELTPPVIADGIRSALRDTESVRALPFVVDQLARGRADAAAPFAQRTLEAADSPAEGLALSIDCAEEIPFNDDARISEAAATGVFAPRLPVRPIREECAAWGVPALSPIENDVVPSGLPVLLLTGDFDPSAPLTSVQAAVVGLSRTAALTLPYAGHDTVASGGCPADIAEGFLRDPLTSPDIGCVDREVPPRFVTTADIDPSSAIRRAYADIIVQRDPVQIAVGGLTSVGLVLTLLYGIGYGLAWLVRRRGGAPEGAVLAASVSAAAHLTFVGALALVIAATDRAVLIFGLPPAAWPLILLPLVGLAAAVVLIVLLVRAWAGGDGSFGDRLVLSLSALASVGFTAWLIGRGLLVW